jgi:hypothetical protein
MSIKQRGKKIVTERFQINSLMMHFQCLDKHEQEQAKPQISRWKEIIKISAEITEMDTKKYKKKINETKVLWKKKEEKINKIDKPIVKLTKRRRENTL